MGKQSRRKQEKDQGLRAATAWFRRIGLPARPEGSAYRRLAAADPAWWRRVTEADDGTPEMYALLYRDLDTALAEYAARAVAVAHPWLRWWSEHHPPATRLLDAGCGPGVLTCAYAAALPDTEVVGIDAVPEAVACARRLAERVGAANATFEVADFTAPTGGRFDQVIAVTALGDAGAYPAGPAGGPDPFSTVADVDGPAAGFTSPAAGALAGHLAPGGHLLVFDRTPYAAQAARLGSALLHAGIDLDLAAAGTEPVMEDGETRTFTRFTGRRTDSPRTAPADVAAWLKAVKPPAYGDVWHDELRFEKVKAAGATRVWAAEINYAPYSPGLERREVWAGPTEAYSWVTTTLGLRQLTRGRSAGALVEESTAYARRLAASGVRVRPLGPRNPEAPGSR